jgi:hypothetical protein
VFGVRGVDHACQLETAKVFIVNIVSDIFEILHVSPGSKVKGLPTTTRACHDSLTSPTCFEEWRSHSVQCCPPQPHPMGSYAHAPSCCWHQPQCCSQPLQMEWLPTEHTGGITSWGGGGWLELPLASCWQLFPPPDPQWCRETGRS